MLTKNPNVSDSNRLSDRELRVFSAVGLQKQFDKARKSKKKKKKKKKKNDTKYSNYKKKSSSFSYTPRTNET